MEIFRVSEEEYLASAEWVFLSVFETPAYNKYNASNCDEVLYFVLGEKRENPAFGIIGGRVGNVCHFPFSAPFSFVSRSKQFVSIDKFQELAKCLVRAPLDLQFDSIRFTVAPECYDVNNVSMFELTMQEAGFKRLYEDINHHFDLFTFGNSYVHELPLKSRQKLNTSLKFDLRFSALELDRIGEVYRIIEDNRREKGYPIKVPVEKFIEMAALIDIELFIVYDKDENGLASAICYRHSDKLSQIIYWGNTPGSEKFKPMNFLAFKLQEHYKNRGFDRIDVGPSSEAGVLNTGLCSFKQSVGAIATKKSTLLYSNA